jgi:soluble P-type ATPase
VLTVSGQVLSLRLGSAAYCQAPVYEGTHLQVSLADDAGWIATFELAEEVRPEAAAVATALKHLGLQLKVLSGDAQSAVAQVASLVGIDDARGACSPQDKLQAVQAWQAQGHRVAMVGDGLNDGPVLAGADVSFALGQALPLAQSKADFVLMGGQLQVKPGVGSRVQRGVHSSGPDGLAAALGGGLGHGAELAAGCAQCLAPVSRFGVQHACSMKEQPWTSCIC